MMVHKIKKILLIYISISLSVSPAMAQIQGGSGDDKFSVSQGKDDGKRAAAANYQASSWTVLSGGLGFWTGPFGPALLAGVSQIGTIKPSGCDRFSIENRPLDYRKAFFKAYAKEAKTKRLKKTLIGGALGFATIALLVLSFRGAY